MDQIILMQVRDHNPSNITYTTICVYISIYLSIYIYSIYIYINNMYVCIYSLRKSNNYSLKSAQNKSVIILREEDDAKKGKFHTGGPTIF